MNTIVDQATVMRGVFSEYEALTELAAKWLRGEGVWAKAGLASVMFTKAEKKAFWTKTSQQEGLVLAIITTRPIKPKVAAHFEEFLKKNAPTHVPIQVQWFSQQAA